MIERGEIIRVSVKGHPRAVAELHAWIKTRQPRAPGGYLQEKFCNLQITCYVWRYWWEINIPGREFEDTLLIDTYPKPSKSKYNVIKSRKTNEQTKNFIRENLLSLYSILFSRSNTYNNRDANSEYWFNQKLWYNYIERIRGGKECEYIFVALHKFKWHHLHWISANIVFLTSHSVASDTQFLWIYVLLS